MILDVFSYEGMLIVSVLAAVATAIRYLIMTGSVYYFFWVRFKDKLKPLYLYSSPPPKAAIIAEIKNSLVSCLIFGGITGMIYYGMHHGWFHIYVHLDDLLMDHSLGSYIFSFLGVILFHDTYFYWMHRALHWKPLFKMFHKTHHDSTKPTPFAMFSFHPAEGLLEGLIVPFYALFFPVHASTIVFFILFSSIFNIIGHIGYEIYPRRWARGHFARWSNSPTHHSMHHEYFNWNYSFYFNIWDYICGTNHPDYLRYDRKLWMSS